MNSQRYLFGKFVSGETPLTADQVLEICRQARIAQQIMNLYPLDKTLSLLSRVQDKWRDPNSPYRIEAMKLMVETTGFSKPMLELGMQELVWSLDADILSRKLEIELRKIPLVYGETFNSRNRTTLRHYPMGSLLHVLSGNVFLVGPGSLIEGLITGNVNILKMPSEEKLFLPLFLKSLLECDTDGVVSSSIAAIDYSSSQTDVIDIFKNQMDGIVVWGGERAIKAYRDGAPARTRIISFGPRLSFSLITSAGMKELGANYIAEQLANELVIWDQQACTAPQVCYVQGAENCKLLLKALDKSVRTAQLKLPPGTPVRDAATEIRKVRSVAEVREALGLGELVDSGSDNLDFTLYSSDSLELEPSPLSRTIKLTPYNEVDEVLTAIDGLRGYLQTVGVASSKFEWESLSHQLAVHGALRILPIGTMSGGEIDDPHDGLYDLPLLVNLVVSRSTGAKGFSPFDLYDSNRRKQLQNIKLRTMIRQAKKSKFYKERLEGVQIDSVDDLQKLRPLTRTEWEENMPPSSSSLMTTESLGGYVTRSGGSTGVPKFSIFDKRDWQEMVDSCVRMFESSGFAYTDRIANFMSAGDLYGSFISFNHVNFALGAQSYCFAHATDPKNFIDIAEKFNINAIQASPPKLMKLLREAKELNPKFTIEKVMFAGMPLSLADREWLKTNVGAKRIISVIGTTESNHIGYQCDHLSGSHHHLTDDYNYIELLDENGKHVSDGVSGRIAVTNLEKMNFPILRYLNGDAARIITRNCECGRKSPVIEYLGRWDDMICFGNMNLVYGDAVKALEPLNFAQVQLIATFKNGGEHLEIVVETDSQNNSVESSVVELLSRDLPEFGDFYNDKGFTLNIQVKKPGSIEVNPRTGKIKGVIDARK